MIRIGNSYFRPEAILAIAPAYGDNKYIVAIQNGGIINIDAPETDVIRANQFISQMDGDMETEPVEIVLSPEELRAINTLHANGFQWIARDKNQHLYAYLHRPASNGVEWSEDEDYTDSPERVIVPLLFISAEDEEPWMIQEIMERGVIYDE